MFIHIHVLTLKLLSPSCHYLCYLKVKHKGMRIFTYKLEVAFSDF